MAVLQWLGDHDAVLAVLVAICGWIATHFLALRAQREQLRFQALDRARVEITAAIRQAQDWYSAAHSAAVSVKVGSDLEVRQLPADFRAAYSTLASLTSNHHIPNQWNARLEEYLALFPECTKVREEMQDRHLRLFKQMVDFTTGLLATLSSNEGSRKRLDLIGEAEAGWMKEHFDEVGLLEDMRVHLQNMTLKRVARKTVPLRKPLDLRAPRICKGADGMLEIRTGAD